VPSGGRALHAETIERAVAVTCNAEEAPSEPCADDRSAFLPTHPPVPFMEVWSLVRRLSLGAAAIAAACDAVEEAFPVPELNAANRSASAAAAAAIESRWPLAGHFVWSRTVAPSVWGRALDGVGLRPETHPNVTALRRPKRCAIRGCNDLVR
jgi:hypothetical protein